MKANAFARAGEVLESALRHSPDDANLLRLLGVSLTRQNRAAEAERPLTRAVRLVPNFALAHENLADALVKQGKFDAAVQSLKAAIKHNPASAGAKRKVGELLVLTGRGGEADELFQQSLAQDPDRAALVEAMELNRQGETGKAEKIFRGLLRRNPENVDALRLMGALCARKENYNDAEAFFRQATDLAPDFWMAWINLGAALNEQQKFGEAEIAYKRAVEIEPDSAFTLEKLGANSMHDGRLEESLVWLNKALELDPAHFPSLLCLGHVLKTVGRQREAIDAYRRCAAAKPDFGEVYWSLANLKTFRFEDSEIQAMQRQLARIRHQLPAADADALAPRGRAPSGHLDVLSRTPAVPSRPRGPAGRRLDALATKVGDGCGLEEVSNTADREDSEIAFAFALGKAFEDRGDYGNAFQSYARGNEKKRFKVNYDPTEFQKTNDRIIEVFSKEFFAAHSGQGFPEESPILIVGLPRSGSTLLEQVLASHSQVEGTQELHYLLRLATETGLNRIDGIKYPECMLELKPHQIRDLGREYIESTLHHRSGARYFTDKMPNNFTGIGFLHTILPNAKVIDARRHPLDSCLGCFKQLFARGQVFTYDLYDLAHYYSEYLRMMHHWAEVLPGKVLTVQYEDVVVDLEVQARRIAEHCGLAWEDRMLRYHETERAVKTASSEQVRQPIYSGSVNLWRRYEDHLGELIDYLEPVLLTLPEEQRPGNSP